jgi:hypothetical protein
VGDFDFGDWCDCGDFGDFGDFGLLILISWAVGRLMGMRLRRRGERRGYFWGRIAFLLTESQWWSTHTRQQGVEPRKNTNKYDLARENDKISIRMQASVS